MKSLRRVVEQDLAPGVGWFPRQDPPPSAKQHNTEILQCTLLRHRSTHGASGEPQASTTMPDKTDDLARGLLATLNGD